MRRGSARGRSGAGRAAPATGSRGAGPERVQKVLARAGVASRRVAEAWIRAGRITINGEPAVLGARVGPRDQLQLDGRAIPCRLRGSRPVVGSSRNRTSGSVTRLIAKSRRRRMPPE